MHGSVLPIAALERFAAKCRFEPETGCVIWMGAKSWGRGKSIRYGGFKFEGKVWLAHRWAAKFIHGFEIDELQVDHCCPNIPIPNTLCVQHVQPLSAERNRHLQTERRRAFVFLEKGLLPFEDIYGPQPEPVNIEDMVPFHEPPEWLSRILGNVDRRESQLRCEGSAEEPPF